MPRLFTGIELPEAIRDGLARLKVPMAGARWIEPRNLHITLRFVGDIENASADTFADLLARTSVDRFDARVMGVGTFGGAEPRVLWAGIEAGPELAELARANDRAARGAGLPAPEHPFRAHVTLARLRYPRVTEIARFLERHGRLASEPFGVEEFVMFSSRPKTGGGPYVVEEVYPLRGGRSLGRVEEEGGW